MLNRRTLFRSAAASAGVCAALAGGSGAAFAGGSDGTTAAAARSGSVGARSRTAPPGERDRLHRWAVDTWRSMAALASADTGLVSDNMSSSLDPASRVRQTSPTNIGGYLWSAVAARDLGVISAGECQQRVRRSLQTLAAMEHHTPSGMYYNWYDYVDGSVIRTWPGTTNRVYPFVSSVDNAWLGAALKLVASAVPPARAAATALFSRMRWDMFYDAAIRPGGLIHGGFYVDEPAPGSAVTKGNHIGAGPDVWYTNHHYDTTVSETRMTTYLGIVTGQIPPQNYYALWRTFPATCDWSWPESQPVGTTRTYYGLDVFEGAYVYRGMSIVPGWGGSMFEELMPDMFVPEATWAPNSWGRNHPRHVRAQREHGMIEAGYGYWGFSPSMDPAGGYREFGVDALGLNPDGYFSDEEKTNVDAGFGDCRPGTNPHPTFGDGVVTPHASFLAMMHDKDAAVANLIGIQDVLGGYGPGGFVDAVATRSGRQARLHLSLDQAMVLGALANVSAGDAIRRYFSTADVESALRPVLEIEEFGLS